MLFPSHWSPKAQTDTETQNRAVIRTAFDAWSAGTGGPFDLTRAGASRTAPDHSHR